MNIKASGRSALFLAAGLWICIAGPANAVENEIAASEPKATVEAAPDKPIALSKFNKPRHAKKVAAKSRKGDPKADKAAAKSSGDDGAKDKAADTAMPPAIANANAQLPAETSSDMTAMAAQVDSMQKLMSGKTDVAAAPEDSNLQVVAADQLNEVDRALSDDKPADKPTLTLARATIDAPAAVVSQDNTAWDQTSLIGKIFIAFGGLLTMASAARMFMA